MCECVDRLNEQLKGHNTKIHVPVMLNKKTLSFEAPRCRVVTSKLDSSKRQAPIELSASYCPFCGEHYETGNNPQGVLSQIANEFMTTEEIHADLDNLGLSYEEYLEMAYENIQQLARMATAQSSPDE